MKNYWAALVLVVFISSSCKRSESEAQAGVKPAEVAPAASLAVAPAWTLRAVDGREVSSADFAGKVVVLDFWATWCPPCLAEIPGFIELQKKYEKEGLVVVGISVDRGGVELVKKFIAENKINYTIVMADEKVADMFGGIEGIPTTFVIDRTGKIQVKEVGFVETAVFEARIKPLLAAPKP